MGENNNSKNKNVILYIIAMIGMICGKILNPKILLVSLVACAVIVNISFIKIIREKKVAQYKYFYQLYISTFLFMLMSILYLSGITLFNWNKVVQKTLLISTAIPFVYFIALGFLTAFTSGDKEKKKKGKSLLILLVLVIIILAILAYRQLSKSH